MKHTIFYLISGFVAAVLLAGVAVAEKKSSKQPVFVETRQLSAASVAKVGNATLAECTKRGYKVGVSIVSREGHLLYFARHPLAGVSTIKISRAKAYTAAAFGILTKDLPQPALNHYAEITTIQGGVPISYGGHHYGGIGVSGAPSKVDEECAEHGLELIEEELEFGD